MKNTKNMKTSSLCWRSRAGLREESQVLLQRKYGFLPVLVRAACAVFNVNIT